MRWFFGIALLVLILPLVVYGQKPTIQLEVDPKVIATNDVFSITVRTTINGEVDIELPDEYIHGYNVMNGMEQDVDYATGKIVTFYYISQTGTFRKPGNYKIGPAVIKKGGKVFKSSSVNLQVNSSSPSASNEIELSAKQLRQPAFGIIETSKKKIYAGEPLLVNAKVFSRFDPTHLESYKPYVVSGALEKHELDGGSRIVVNEEYIKRSLYYSFEHDKKVVFPENIGKITIEPFKLILLRGLDGVPITASSKTIEVVPLPKGAPKSFTGGVGQFTITQKVDKTFLKQGDVIDIELEITGHGNLHALHQPDLQLPKGFKLYGDPTIKEDIVFGRKGAEGKLTIDYHVKVLESGSIELPITTFAFFDPEKEKYIVLKTKSETLTVESNPEFNDKNDIVENKTEPVHTDKNTFTSSPPQNKKSSSSWSSWMFIGTPLSLAFIGLLLWWGKKSPQQSDKKTKPTSISIEKANEESKIALAYFASSDYTNAIQHLKKALLFAAIRHLKLEEESLSSIEIRSIWQKQQPNDPLFGAFEAALEQCDMILYSGWNLKSSESNFFQKTIDLINKINQ
jgi:nitrogen fixation-related uncharacterized protein